LQLWHALTVGGAGAAAVLLFGWLWSRRHLRDGAVSAVASALTDGAVSSASSVRAAVDALRQAVDGLSATVSAQGDQLKTADARIGALEEKVAKRERRIAALERELRDTQAALEAERGENAQLRHRIDELEVELARLRGFHRPGSSGDE
jgi:chromosome segregation ATPase